MPPRKGFSTHSDFASHMLGVVGDWDEETASSLYLDAPEYWQWPIVPMKKRSRYGGGFRAGKELACVFPNTEEGATKPLILVVCEGDETFLSFMGRGIITLHAEKVMKERGTLMTASEIVAKGWTVD